MQYLKSKSAKPSSQYIDWENQISELENWWVFHVFWGKDEERNMISFKWEILMIDLVNSPYMPNMHSIWKEEITNNESKK